MRKRILLIDDDEEICEELSVILRNEGYLVETVFDGLKARELMEKQGYDLFLLDLKLPGLSGFDLLKIIRGQRIRGRVLVLTGRPLLSRREGDEGLTAQDKDEEDTLELADAIINKPFEIKPLLNRVRNLLR